jgi:hypothetical protein
MDHPSSQGNTPASAPEPKIVLASNSGGGGMKRGAGNQREEAWVGGGGKEGVGEHMCGRLFESASSLRKNYKAITLESFTHIFLGDCNYYYAQ